MNARKDFDRQSSLPHNSAPAGEKICRETERRFAALSPPKEHSNKSPRRSHSRDPPFNVKNLELWSKRYTTLKVEGTSPLHSDVQRMMNIGLDMIEKGTKEDLLLLHYGREEADRQSKQCEQALKHAGRGFMQSVLCLDTARRNQTSINAAKRVIDSMVDRVEESARELAATKQKLENAEKSVVDRSSDLASLKKEYTVLEKKLAATQQEMTSLSSKCDRANADFDKVTAECKSLQKMLDVERARSESLIKDVEKTKKEVRDVKAKTKIAVKEAVDAISKKHAQEIKRLTNEHSAKLEKLRDEYEDAIQCAEYEQFINGMNWLRHAAKEKDAAIGAQLENIRYDGEDALDAEPANLDDAEKTDIVSEQQVRELPAVGQRTIETSDSPNVLAPPLHVPDIDASVDFTTLFKDLNAIEEAFTHNEHGQAYDLDSILAEVPECQEMEEPAETGNQRKAWPAPLYSNEAHKENSKEPSPKAP